MSYILHSTPTLPLAFLSTYDEENGLSMHYTPPGSSDGFMLIAKDSKAPQFPSPPVPVMDALSTDSWSEVVSRLVETYFVDISPMIPVVTREDMGDASPTLVHAMAGVAAGRRNCPKEIFDTLRYIIKKHLDEQGEDLPVSHIFCSQEDRLLAYANLRNRRDQ